MVGTEKAKDFGNTLTKLRKERGKIQKEVANDLGIERATYASYELGRREPAYDLLIRIADYFEVTTDFLLCRTKEKGVNSFENNVVTPEKKLNFDEFKYIWYAKKTFSPIIFEEMMSEVKNAFNRALQNDMKISIETDKQETIA